MSDITLVCPVQNSIITKNLYYDLIDNQFIINNDKIREQLLNSLSWYGRNNPSFIGKNIIIKKIMENNGNIENVTIGNNESQTILLSRRYSPHNFGHLLCETAIPIEYTFNLFKIKDKSERIIVFDDCCWDGFNNSNENSIYWFEGDDICRRNCCDLFSKNLFNPIADSVIFNFKNYITNKKYNNRYVKINNNVIFGIGGISPWVRDWKNESSIIKTIDTLNEKIFNSYLPTFNSNPIIPNTLTFIIKIGRRQVLNWEDVGLILKQYADSKNLLYEQFNLDDISFEKQIEVLSRTKILFTNGGSSAFCSLFLPKGTDLIYFPILNNDFETSLFKEINRCKLIIYENYDKWWKSNIKREDGSFLVDLEIINTILSNL